MKLKELKEITDIELIKDSDFKNLGYISHSQPKQLIYLEDKRFIPVILKKNNISSIITTRRLSALLPKKFGICISNNPKKSFYEIHNHLVKDTDFYWTPFRSEIANSAKINPTAYISEKNIRIGKNCIIGPNVSILEGSIIKDNVIIRAGCVIGTEGFQFVRFGKNILPIIHAGGVLIHNGVELQANCCVSKAVFGGFTEIGENTKLDNLVHIAHNVKIGKRCLFAACDMIAGSVVIGDDVWVGPAAVISSEITIGNGAIITLGSVVTKNVLSGKRVTGNFAIDHDRFIKFIKSIR